MTIPYCVFCYLIFHAILDSLGLIFWLAVLISVIIIKIRDFHDLVYENADDIKRLEKDIETVSWTDYDELQKIKAEVRKLKGNKKK